VLQENCKAISLQIPSRRANERGAWQVSVSELAYKEGAAANTGALLAPRTFFVIVISLAKKTRALVFACAYARSAISISNFPDYCAREGIYLLQVLFAVHDN
jgi:hypothetical protein